MKKIIYIYIWMIVLCFASFFSGCEKGLDPQFYSTLTTENFPNNRDDYESLTLSTYAPLQGKWSFANANDWGGYSFHCFEQYSILFYNDLSSDICAIYKNGWGGDWLNGSNGDFTYLINSVSPYSHFSKVRYISRITKIIDQLNTASADNLSENDKKTLLAEARMSRGWIMWYLLYYYGPVPVIMDAGKIGTDAEWDLTQPDRNTFVNWINDDLQFAADNLPKSWPDGYYGRYTKGLALTVQMRLYMNEHKWQEAINTGNLIKSMGYSLVADYQSLFVPSGEGNKNKEIIYAISTSEKSGGGEQDFNFNPIHYYLYPDWYYTPNFSKGGWSTPDGVYEAHWDFVNSFDTLDKRRLFVTSFTDKKGKVHDKKNMNGALVVKFKEETTGTTYRGNDIVLARYADVLLMLAEAISEVNGGPNTEAIGYVNEVRTRAGLGNLSTTDIANSEVFKDALLRERGWELYFEGLRRYDLMRMNKWDEKLTACGKIKGPSPLLPLPQYAINAGKGTLKQTNPYK